MSPTASTFVSQNKRMIGIILTVCLLLTAIGIYGTRMWRSPRSESQGPAVAAPAAEPERRLAYWLMVQKYRNGKPYQEPFRLVGEINFEKDYRVRLNLSGLQDGYLYILNEGPAPSGRNTPFIVLFPSPTANNGLSRLAANQQIQVPEQSWFQFDAEQGTEKVWMVWSANSVPALEAVKGFVNPRDRGLVSDPDLNNAVRDFLQAHQSPGPMMERDEEKKEVVIKSNGDILAYLLRLEHH